MKYLDEYRDSKAAQKYVYDTHRHHQIQSKTNSVLDQRKRKIHYKLPVQQMDAPVAE